MAVTNVASKTPRALYSLLIFRNPKNAAKLGKAPRVRSIQRFCEFKYKLKVAINSWSFSWATIKVQTITPNVLLIIPTKKPINISFFILDIPRINVLNNVMCS